MTAQTLRTITLAATVAAAALACAPPPPPPAPQVGTVQYVTIQDTPEWRAWCINHPGGALEWDAQHRLTCRIVP
jgi:hypothetical protein